MHLRTSIVLHQEGAARNFSESSIEALFQSKVFVLLFSVFSAPNLNDVSFFGDDDAYAAWPDDQHADRVDWGLRFSTGCGRATISEFPCSHGVP